MFRSREEENLIGLKQIMKKYNCKSLELRGRELERLFQFMIRKEDEEGFRDALEVSLSLSLSSLAQA